MRKLDYEKAFSSEDVVWLRQAGFMSEEQIARHQAQFDAEIPEIDAPEDEVTRSALDPTARRNGEYVPSDGAPQLVDPTQVDPPADEDEGDDYDKWTVKELEDEAAARNRLAHDSDGEIGAVEVTGTGKDGKVLKGDLVKGLRLWDQENPEALKD